MKARKIIVWSTIKELKRNAQVYPICLSDEARRIRKEMGLAEPKHIVDAHLWAIGRHPYQLSGNYTKKEDKAPDVKPVITTKQLDLFDNE